MCGIAGYIDTRKKIDPDVFGRMLDTIRHRGPDDSGVYFNASRTVALGHRRLSFLDLTAAGRQPLSDPDRNVHVTFNGEIYNYRELRSELRSYPFRTNTDTEVLIAAYKTWGITFINKLKGMFAFALLDERSNKLYLVRDRFGIKPLYYHPGSSRFMFASELKAIVRHDEVPRELDHAAFTDYFVYRYVPSPRTIWKHIFKLPPAHLLTLDTQTLQFTTTEYWKLASSGKTVDPRELAGETGALLDVSVRQHLLADVPVGSFLSGGYDSSALVYLARQQGTILPTFSIGFENWERSEDHYARIVAEHLDVPNESVTADERSLELLDLMPDVYDEPIADISIIPTYMVSRLARGKVKAVLSGEGADELFGGYTWQHAFFQRAHGASWIDKLKGFIRQNGTVEYYAQAMAMGRFDRAELKKMLQPGVHPHIQDDVDWFYRRNFHRELSPLKSIQLMDIKCFMGELVLTKIDRASMANSLEVRVPFLDHELFEKVFSVDERLYFRQDQTKFLLYENIRHALPQEILQRKKQGFVGPDAYYMNLDFYRRQLKNSRLVSSGLIRQSYLDELLTQTYNWKLWKILVMEKWLDKWLG